MAPALIWHPVYLFDLPQAYTLCTGWWQSALQHHVATLVSQHVPCIKYVYSFFEAGAASMEVGRQQKESQKAKTHTAGRIGGETGMASTSPLPISVIPTVVAAPLPMTQQEVGLAVMCYRGTNLELEMMYSKWCTAHQLRSERKAVVQSRLVQGGIYLETHVCKHQPTLHTVFTHRVFNSTAITQSTIVQVYWLEVTKCLLATSSNVWMSRVLHRILAHVGRRT